MKLLNKILLTLILCLSIFMSFNLSSKAATSTSEYIKQYTSNTTEMRAVWVCTVSNMDISQQVGTSDEAIEKWKAEYLKIVENAVEFRLNTIIFQVRPCNDAFYPSKYNPWSEFLAGYGVDPGWDPLEWMIEVTHAAGLEYHAWLNPYRTSVTTLSTNITTTETSGSFLGDYDDAACQQYKHEYFGNLRKKCVDNGTLVDNPIFEDGNDLEYDVLFGTEGKFILNPASENTLTLLNNTIEELITNYDLDGIHFDDYFYPNSCSYRGTNTEYKQYGVFSCEPKVDVADYNKYLATDPETVLSIHDWRRSNTDKLISNLSTIIRNYNNSKESKHKCAFGISPAARWAPSPESCPASTQYRAAEGGMSGSCNNYYSYSDLYANTLKWCLEEWIDYIVPQVYTYTGFDQNTGVMSGSYTEIVDWWDNALKDSSTKLYIGTPAYQVESWSNKKTASIAELAIEVTYNSVKQNKVEGYYIFRYESIINKQKGGAATLYKTLIANCWKDNALTPLYDAYTYPAATDYAKFTSADYNPDGSYIIYFEQVLSAKAYALTENGTIVKTVLSGANSFYMSTLDKTKTYEIVTYGYDNKLYSSSSKVDLTTIKENELPTISCRSTINKSYLKGDKLNLEFKVVDKENDELTYEVSYEGMVYASGKVEDETVKVTIGLFAEDYDQSVTIKVKDPYGDVSLTTDTFRVFETIEEMDNYDSDNTDQTDPVEPDPTPSKGCNNSYVTIILLITCITSCLYIFRKR